MKLKSQLPASCLLLLSLTMLMSCGGLLNSDKAVDKTFWLQPYKSNKPTNTLPAPRGLSVAFTVIPGLDSDLLLTMNPDAELNHFSGARWPDHLPELVGSLVQRSISDSGLFASVSSDRDSNTGDCELSLELQDFYTRTNRNGLASSVQMSLMGHLDCDGDSSYLKMESTTPVQGQSLAEIVAAHQSGLDRVLESLLLQIEKASQIEESA
jgi:ABC-type uncharacterized transport system auxiliary subunit